MYAYEQLAKGIQYINHSHCQDWIETIQPSTESKTNVSRMTNDTLQEKIGIHVNQISSERTPTHSKHHYEARKQRMPILENNGRVSNVLVRVPIVINLNQHTELTNNVFVCKEYK